MIPSQESHTKILVPCSFYLPTKDAIACDKIYVSTIVLQEWLNEILVQGRERMSLKMAKQYFISSFFQQSDFRKKYNNFCALRYIEIWNQHNMQSQNLHAARNEFNFARPIIT